MLANEGFICMAKLFSIVLALRSILAMLLFAIYKLNKAVLLLTSRLVNGVPYSLSIDKTNNPVLLLTSTVPEKLLLPK